MKTLSKMCGSVIIAILLSFAVWYFLLIDIPDTWVQGIAAPAMSKEEALDLMNFHGVKVIYVKDGQWYFRRNGEAILLKKPRN